MPLRLENYWIWRKTPNISSWLLAETVLVSASFLTKAINGLSMPYVVIDLDIPQDHYLAYYRGSAHTVHARSRDGRAIQFPAKILQPFVAHNGIQGSFIVHFDNAGRFEKVERLLKPL